MRWLCLRHRRTAQHPRAGWRRSQGFFGSRPAARYGTHSAREAGTPNPLNAIRSVNRQRHAVAPSNCRPCRPTPCDALPVSSIGQVGAADSLRSPTHGLLGGKQRTVLQRSAELKDHHELHRRILDSSGRNLEGGARCRQRKVHERPAHEGAGRHALRRQADGLRRVRAAARLVINHCSTPPPHHHPRGFRHERSSLPVFQWPL